MFLNVAGDLFPIAARIGMEDTRERTPAAVAGEDGFLGFSSFAAFVLDQPQRANGLDIIAGLFLQPALPDPVSLDYSEVSRRRGRFRLDVGYFNVADGGMSPLLLSCMFSSGGNAHSSRISSHAAR